MLSNYCFFCLPFLSIYHSVSYLQSQWSSNTFQDPGSGYSQSSPFLGSQSSPTILSSYQAHSKTLALVLFFSDLFWANASRTTFLLLLFYCCQICKVSCFCSIYKCFKILQMKLKREKWPSYYFTITHGREGNWSVNLDLSLFLISWANKISLNDAFLV